MGMCALRDISQAEVENLLGGIKGVPTYINDISLLKNERFYKQIDRLSVIFARLSDAELKLNAPK